MSLHVDGENLSDAWVAAFAALGGAKGCEAANLTVTIANPTLEILRVRRAIDAQVAELGASGQHQFNKSVHTVANTIFPISLYREDHPQAFFESAIRGQSGRNGSITSWGANGGTYIGRLLSYPTYGGESFNQIARMLKNLDAEQNYQDSYEMSLACEPPDCENPVPGHTTSASTFVPGYDNNHRGGQCLSHVSLNLSRNRVLSMVALYRHQTYVSRAYGNFLGLARLLHFLVRESRKDLTVGELMVVASHAEIDQQARGGRAVLLEKCNSYLADGPTPIEWQSRPLGARWSDLNLPKVPA